MRIAVIGAGAMGSLFGAMLVEAGRQVTLIDVNADHVNQINARGLYLESEAGARTVRVNAATPRHAESSVDLALVFVKSNHTEPAARQAAALVQSTGHVLTLQNGWGNPDVIARYVPAERIIAGTTAHGATFLQAGRIRHAGVGPTVIGPWKADGLQSAQRVAACLTQAGLEARAVADIRPVMWHKLLINVGINAITALTGIKNGQLLDLPATRALCRSAVEEAMAVARASGIPIPEDMVEQVFQVAEATGGNRSSMGQDIDHRRPTEIGVINGAVVRMAEEKNLGCPVNRTLTALVKTMEAHFKPAE